MRAFKCSKKYVKIGPNEGGCSVNFYMSSSNTRQFLKLPPTPSKNGHLSNNTPPIYIQPNINRISSQDVTITLHQLTITPIASPPLPFINLLPSLFGLFRPFALAIFAAAISIGFNVRLNFKSSASLLYC